MAHILYKCRSCRSHIRSQDDRVGESLHCPSCNTEYQVPAAVGDIACGQCGEIVCYAAEAQGDSYHCPKCRHDLIIPTKASFNGSGGKKAKGGTPSVKRESTGGGFFSFGKVKEWCLVNCLTGESQMIDKLPFEIGSGQAVDLRLDGIQEHCVAIVNTKEHGVCLMPRDASAVIFLNGKNLTQPIPLAANTDYSLKLGNHLFALHGGRNVENWLKQVDIQHWYAFDASANSVVGPTTLVEMPHNLQAHRLKVRDTVVYPQGLKFGFYVWQLAEIFQSFAPPPPQENPLEGIELEDEILVGELVQSENGSLKCPVCWSAFDKGNIMHIAVHESLRNDPVLGEDAMLRFHASRFNDQGQALDSMGLPCPDIACPQCRRKLPPGFLDVPHHIFSLVGAPSAGKSYYLSVLAKVLPQALYNDFGIVFKDADPTGNATLNAMKTRLFSGATPEEVQLDKTALEGEMYERLPRQGRNVALPKPFIFSVGHKNNGASRFSLVFYDNAGEHFEPGIDEMMSPGAQHVASASTIFFLFDPTVSREFRARLADHPDPQLKLVHRYDQQDTILAEMEVRIKRLLHLKTSDKINTPLAVLVGKCDVWMHMMGRKKLQSVVADGQLDMEALVANSDAVRSLLLDISPSIVANAESLAKNVMYFPVSSFGHSPIKLAEGRIAPDPHKLKPMFVEVPIIWALSQTAPEIMPVRNK